MTEAPRATGAAIPDGPLVAAVDTGTTRARAAVVDLEGNRLQ